MEESEELLYDALHRRCSPGYFLKLLQGTNRLHADYFVREFDIAESTNPYYVKTIVKILIDNLNILSENETEALGKVEVINSEDRYLSEWLYEKYVALLHVERPCPTAKDIIQYSLNPQVKIRMEETPQIISGSGTTGFRTWEASLFLADYLLRNDFPYKNVLELGAGTSMVSAVVAKTHQDSLEKLYITDGDSTLLETTSRRNFQLNGLVDNKKFQFRRLWWNEDMVPDDVDLVLAADVTYDSTVVPDLCHCLLQCLNNGRCSQCLVSATIRNEETIKVFEDHLRNLEMVFKIVAVVKTTDTNKTESLYGSLIAPVRIYCITMAI